MSGPGPADDVQVPRRPRLRDRAVSVDVGLERVIYDTVSGELFRLDPIGALVWPFLDGTATLADLAEDLAYAFDEDREQVHSALVALVERLARLDLLDG